jgi:serine/threonine protein kinase
MHQRHIAHLDISLRNILTDNRGHYAYIDYELSRRFDCSMPAPQIQPHRATEITPESERGEASDPYKTDVWALAVLILRASQVPMKYKSIALPTDFQSHLGDGFSRPRTAPVDRTDVTR